MVIEHKVGVESRAHRLRIRPLGHEHRVGIVLVEHLAYIAPYLARSGLVAAVAVVLDERISHIHAEPVDAAIEPESNHLFEPLARLERRFGLVRRLPGRIVHAVEAVVERGLRRKEVYYIIAFAVVPARYRLEALGEIPLVVRPNEPIRKLVRRRLGAAQEVRVLLGRVPGHEVEYYLYPLGVRRLDELVEVLLAAEPLRHLKVIAYVVTAVHERRIVHRVEP